MPTIVLSTVSFSLVDVGEIIQNLNPIKAHAHDNISIHILKICGSTIYRPLERIFKEAVSTNLLPFEWKTSFLSLKKVISKS